MAVALPRTRGREALHIVVDSTGVKVFGEGEWKVRQHGDTSQRTNGIKLRICRVLRLRRFAPTLSMKGFFSTFYYPLALSVAKSKGALT